MTCFYNTNIKYLNKSHIIIIFVELVKMPYIDQNTPQNVNILPIKIIKLR